MQIDTMQTDKTLPSPPQSGGLHPKKKMIRLSLWVLLLILAAALFLTDWSVKSKRSGLEKTIHNRLQVLAQSRVDVLSNWLTGLAEQGNQIIQSDLFRLYAAEIDLIENDIVLLLADPQGSGQSQELAPLAEQLPLMQNLLEEFTRYSDFSAGRIINKSGQSYIATDAETTALDEGQRLLAKQALRDNRVLYSTAHSSGNGLMMQIYLPIKAPAMSDPDEHPVAVLQLSKNVSAKINEILSSAPLIDKGEITRLLQYQGQDLVELVPWLPGEIYAIDNIAISGPEQSFAKRVSPRDQRTVYSLSVKIPQLDWWVLQETDYAAAIRPLTRYRTTTIIMITLGSLLLLVLIGALWWRLLGTESKKIAEAFKQQAEQIEEQRQFLDNINANLSEYISLKDNRGMYIYINQAFADAVGREQQNIIGLDDAAIFGFDTARRLANSDQRVIQTREQLTVSEELYLQSKRYDMQISKAPFIDAQGQIKGILASYRDVTEIVDNQKKLQKATRQTIEVMVKAVELNDPYLAGHSRLMSRFAVETAKAMNCTVDQQATLKTSSYLSQLGKMFIDSHLLQKPGSLSNEEKKEVEKHVGYTIGILDGVDFDLPIAATIGEMNENLDGSGYPAGLKGTDISTTARILNAVNSFCAMLQPRSYRSARSVDEILAILKDESHKYDEKVLAALEQVALSWIGEQIIEESTSD